MRLDSLRSLAAAAGASLSTSAGPTDGSSGRIAATRACPERAHGIRASRRGLLGCAVVLALSACTAHTPPAAPRSAHPFRRSSSWASSLSNRSRPGTVLRPRGSAASRAWRWTRRRESCSASATRAGPTACSCSGPSRGASVPRRPDGPTSRCRSVPGSTRADRPRGARDDARRPVVRRVGRHRTSGAACASGDRRVHAARGLRRPARDPVEVHPSRDRTADARRARERRVRKPHADARRAAPVDRDRNGAGAGRRTCRRPSRGRWPGSSSTKRTADRSSRAASLRIRSIRCRQRRFTPGIFISGLVELLALSDTELLSLERAYAEEAGGQRRNMNRIRIFHTSLAGATDISSFDSLRGRAGRDARPQDARAGSGRRPRPLPGASRACENFEGMGFGPAAARRQPHASARQRRQLQSSASGPRSSCSGW